MGDLPAGIAFHDNDLRVGKLAGVYMELEGPEVLVHRGVAVAQKLGLLHLLGVLLSHLEGQRVLAEAQIFGGHKPGQEDVDPLAHAEGEGNHAVRP
eukprot:scaffold6032_cov36-Prasinocladus_malaysianus.AAC.1